MKRAFRTFLVSLGLAVLVVPLGAALVAAEDSTNVLRVAVPARPPGLGNPYSSLPVGAINSNYVLFDALTLIGDKGAVLPALALSWRSEGESAWLFELRPDVVFSNGEPLTAQSVVDVLTFLRSPEAGGYLVSGETQMIESAEVVDDLTVRINTNRPDAILPKRMSFVFMIPMTYWKEVGSDGFSLEPVGSGPFKLKDWGQTTGRFVFERNNLSWRKAADFDEISFTAVGDVVSRAQSMLSDQIDLSFKLSLDLLTDLNAAGFKTLARETYSIGAWAFHQVDKTSPISDIRVRRALNMAVDRDAIAKSVLSGVTAPVSQVATSEVFGYVPGLPNFPYDPVAARALLKEAGYGNGLKLKATVRSDPSVPESALIYQVVAQNLSAIGVDVELSPIPGTRWLGMYFSGDWQGSDILDTSFNNSIHGDAIRSIETASCLKAGAFFCDEAMLPLIEASNAEFDIAARERKLQELVTALHHNPPALYLFPYFDTLAYSSKLDDLPITGQRVNLEQIRRRSP